MTTFDIVKNILIDKSGVDVDITPESKLSDELGLDSLDLIELTMEIERQFGIIIPDEKVEQVEAVNDMVLLVETLKN